MYNKYNPIILFNFALEYLAASTCLLNREHCGHVWLLPRLFITQIPIYLSYQWPMAGELNSSLHFKMHTCCCAAWLWARLQHRTMETPTATISADSSGLSTHSPSMNEQPSGLNSTTADPPHTHKKKALSPVLKMPEVLLPSHPIPCSCSVFLFASKESREPGMGMHNDCWWCCACTLVDGGWQFVL